MKKYLNISSVVMLMVYSGLTLFAIPLHHHAQVDVESLHHSNIQTSHDCGVCVFASISVSYPHPYSILPALEFDEELLNIEYSGSRMAVFSKEFPRRGPPVILS